MPKLTRAGRELGVRGDSFSRLTVMRWMVGLLTVLLTGCQGLSLLDVPPERDPQIMPLWEQYQRCRVATDPDELIHLVHHLDAVRVTGVPPPAWLTGWGPHVKPQPIRTTIDPQAISDGPSISEC